MSMTSNRTTTSAAIRPHPCSKLRGNCMTIPASILLLSVTTAAPCARDNASRFHTPRPVHAAQSVVAPHAADRVAIAVFSNISAAAADDWIGVGIAETLGADLRATRGLDVISRSVVERAVANLIAGDPSAPGEKLDGRARSDTRRLQWKRHSCGTKET